jgi:hypothetical protein
MLCGTIYIFKYLLIFLLAIKPSKAGCIKHGIVPDSKVGIVIKRFKAFKTRKNIYFYEPKPFIFINCYINAKLSKMLSPTLHSVPLHSHFCPSILCCS